MEWIGDVPEHWDVTRARWLFEIRKRIAGELGFDVFSITQQGFRVKDLDSNEGQVSLDYSKYQFVEVGDFAMNHMDLITGGVDIAQSRGVTSPDYRVFSIRDRLRVSDRYFLYLFQNCLRERIFFAYGQGSSQLGRWRFPADNFKNFRFPVPPPVEQGLVAAFLDRETAKIDALVAEQFRLIDLMKEKRQAVISHAVTKGFDPHAPMKPSGIEWLGDVPAHWQVRRMSHLMSEPPKNGLSPEISAQGTIQTFSTAALRDGVVAIAEEHLKWVTISQAEGTAVSCVRRGRARTSREWKQGLRRQGWNCRESACWRMHLPRHLDQSSSESAHAAQLRCGTAE